MRQPVIPAVAVAVVVCGSACAPFVERGGTDIATGANTGMASSSLTKRSPDQPVRDAENSEVLVPAPIAEKWNSTGGSAGPLGAALGPAVDEGSTSRVDFAGGSIFATNSGRAFVVQGEILRTYDDEGGPAGPLGAPKSDEATTDGGWISVFERGSIVFIDGQATVTSK